MVNHGLLTSLSTVARAGFLSVYETTLLRERSRVLARGEHKFSWRVRTYNCVASALSLARLVTCTWPLGTTSAAGLGVGALEAGDRRPLIEGLPAQPVRRRVRSRERIDGYSTADWTVIALPHDRAVKSSPRRGTG
jgi:hypothetical protein